MFGEDDPSVVLSTFFAEIFELEGDELKQAKRLKREWIDSWTGDRLDGHALKVTVDILKRALRRLKPGKSSPDEVTAEMLKVLPGPALESLARDFTRRFGMLDVRESWVEFNATLIPKIAAAGYVWMELLPDLRFKTLQTAFVKGVDAAQGGLLNQEGCRIRTGMDLPTFRCPN